MKTRVSSEQAKLLVANEETRDLATRMVRNDVDEAIFSLVGTPDEFDTLRDACSDLLLRIGFDENYVATSEGKMLEDLVDRLYVG